MDDCDDESDLPEHAVSMRAAVRHCITLINDLNEEGSRQRVIVSRQTIDSIETLDSSRQDAYNAFWERLHSLDYNNAPIQTISALENSCLSPSNFRRDYHFRNVPCLIRYDDDLPRHRNPFARVNEEWRSKDRQHINPQWFLDQVGAETLVPLRYYPLNGDAILDSAGRAAEQQTRKVKMKEWIDMVSVEQHDHKYYLKDWHLAALLNQKHHSTPLYTCPEIFQHDLLNPFLTEFTKGDYKFCYWGPKDSTTFRHSDVLHSFSWSYNVHGTKKWTFFGGEDCNQQFTVLQEAGQAMFVPCTWQHEVLNLEETISINHNWITVANIDKTFDCLLVELSEIHNELKEWGICESSDNFLEASESMLRGCVGLNITSFFLALLWRLSNLLNTISEEQLYQGDEVAVEFEFECCRISRMLRTMMRDEKLRFLNIEGRIEATTLSKELAREAIAIATIAVGCVCEEDIVH